MGLRQRQSEFAQAVALLIQKVDELDMECTLGDCFRDSRVHGDFGIKKAYGRANSVHKLRMAIDLNLFIDGEYITDDRGHKQLGKWWEKTFREFDACWGGRFNGDYNHYSFRVWGSA